MTLSNNALADRAETVRELIAASDAAHMESINKALEAGQHLLAAKEECKHGEWLPFLERAGIHERQARRLMQIVRAKLTSDTVSDLGGIKGALEFLAKREKASKAMNDAIVDGAIDLRKMRYALKQLDAIVLEFSNDEVDNIIREVDPSDAFIDAIENRCLPRAGRHLEITARAGDRITAAGVCWPSVEHDGFYYCAVITNPPYPDDFDATVGSSVVWTKRPLTGKPYQIDGVLHEAVWSFFERNMGAPATLWEFDEEGVLPEVLAETLDLPFLVRESEFGKKWRDVDSEIVADMLTSAGIVPPYPEAAR